MDAEGLVKKAKKGNWQAYLDLALARKDSLYYKALSLLGNEHDAADAVEEALVKGYNSISSLEQDRFFQSWLVRILINTCIDIQRSRRKTVFLHDLAESKEPVAVENESDPDLRTQVEAMDEIHRTVLILRYYEDMKVDDIAQFLKVPPGTVKSRLYWGLKKLRLGLERGQVNEM